jgi:hypothetical protein
MRFLIMMLAGSVALAQTGRVLRLTQNENRQELDQIAYVLSGVGGIRQASINDTEQTLTVEGAAGQISTAVWLVQQLDVPANGPPGRSARIPAAPH